jgi:hypothetical protein
MVIPNYTYLKLKMPGPKGINTVRPSFEHAFKCDVECVEHTEVLALDEALMADMEKLANKALGSPNKHSGSFEATEHTKAMPLDPNTPEGKMLRVSSSVDLK